VNFPFEKMAEFSGYQAEARQAARGLWGGCEVREQNGPQSTNDIST
jgi:hypothetical protein